MPVKIFYSKKSGNLNIQIPLDVKGKPSGSGKTDILAKNENGPFLTLDESHGLDGKYYLAYTLLRAKSFTKKKSVKVSKKGDT
jgi:hypothetical protein